MKCIDYNANFRKSHIGIDEMENVIHVISGNNTILSEIESQYNL